MEGFEEIINEFLVESYESLDRLDDDLLALEDSPEDRERLASIFRTVHTIKGTSGVLALPKLERVAHVGENLLVPLRDGEFELNRDLADVLLEMVDAIRSILAQLESDGGEGDEDYEDLAARLQAALQESRDLTQATRDDATGNADDTPSIDVAESTQNDEPTCDQPVASQTTVTSTALPVPSAAPANSPAPDSNTAGGSNTAAKSGKAAGTGKKSGSNTSTSEKSQSVTDSSVRIDVGLLDKLMNLVGELVLARNQIMQFGGTTEDTSMIAASQRLNLITTELQEGVMKTRMQPIRDAWSKLPRVVRDLSASCGKKVEVRMEGADTELDKTILEAIKDPFTHIVRNSVDHGIESPDVRESVGKPAEGVLCLRAFHEGGQVNIEITDDGGGINADRVRQKAIENQMVTAEQAELMSERELNNLILLPGFSTAAKVTNVSGRGVGMDVVKTNIERIGGTLEIQSHAGKGTTLRIKIPLTLAIVPALIVSSREDQYAIPQVSLLELVRLDSDRAHDEIEFIHDIPVYRLRGNLLPLVYLDEQLGTRTGRSRRDAAESVNIVVLQAEDRQFGLVVDSVTDTQEIVVKPLGAHLKAIPAYAGATIMGDGTVSLILDVNGLAQTSGVLSEHRDRTLSSDRAKELATVTDTESLLVVEVGDGTRAGIQLSTVARLEEFAAEAIERSGQNQVVQYRGKILPLISLMGGYGGFESMVNEATGRLHTVVFTESGYSVGIVVGQIVGIVQQRIETQGDSRKQIIIQDRVTEIIDLKELVQMSLPAGAGRWSPA